MTHAHNPGYTRWTWIVAVLLFLILLLAWLLGFWKASECCSGTGGGSALGSVPAVVPPPPPMSPAPAPVAAAPVEKAPEKPAPVATPGSAFANCDPAVVKPLSFALGSTQPGPRARAQLLELAKCLKGSTDKLEIAAHTDNTGNPALNLEISSIRAQKVANFLVRAGVAKERISAKGYGEAEPVADNSTPAGRLQNRRVAFVKLPGA